MELSKRTCEVSQFSFVLVRRLLLSVLAIIILLLETSCSNHDAIVSCDSKPNKLQLSYMSQVCSIRPSGYKFY